MPELLLIAVPRIIIDGVALSGAPVASSSFATPARCARFVWSTSFIGGPSAVSVSIEGSFDQTNWFALDSSTTTTGAVRQIISSAVPFVRGKINSATGGTTGTVTIMFKDTF